MIRLIISVLCLFHGCLYSARQERPIVSRPQRHSAPGVDASGGMPGFQAPSNYYNTFNIGNIINDGFDANDISGRVTPPQQPGPRQMPTTPPARPRSPNWSSWRLTSDMVP